MLYVLHGTDSEKGKEKLRELVSALQKKRPDAATLSFDGETFEISKIDDLIHGQGLFSPKSIVVLDRVLEDADTLVSFSSQLKEIAASENVFVLLAGKIDAKTKKKFTSHAAKMQGFDKKKVETKSFNTFSLTDALGERNRVKLWSKYQEAKLRGVSDEEIHGILFWQVKSLLLASGAGSAKEAGLNPFVYKKASLYAKNYSKEELQKLSGKLVHIYHSARRGKHELGSALEQVLLSA